MAGENNTYYKDNLIALYHKDCQNMSELADNSIDLIVTDPPYGYSFMGKDWDKAVIPVDIWKECLRVLKPGAFAFVMCSPRQDCLGKMVCNLSDAGFETGFTSLYWAYASGFPKAQNIGKAVDKRGGVSVSWFGEWLKKWRTEKGIPQKEVAKLFPSKTGGLTGCVANWELGLNMPTPLEFTTICRHFNLPFESIEEAEREVLGIERIRTKQNWCPTSQDNNTYITEAQTKEAKALDGSYGGFQPKPAVEVILVAMKPLDEKTFVDQALKNRKGISWLDDGRIPYENQSDIDQNRRPQSIKHKSHGTFAFNQKSLLHKDAMFNQQGRFPTNLLVSDDVLNDGREYSSGGNTGREKRRAFSQESNLMVAIDQTKKHCVIDKSSGSFSRYFDLDKWTQKTFPFLIVPKASKGEKNKGLYGREEQTVSDGRNKSIDNPFQRGETPRKNIHPTCKPLKLMSYLITLGSREGDTILDPFVGSGTTCLASKLLNRKSVGYELKEQYCEIAVARCRQMILEM